MVGLDVEKNGSGTTMGLTRYGLGGRGIDVVATTTSSGNTASYPIYDTHGNIVGLLSKNGSSFAVSNEKSYDAWGGLRTGTNANGKAAYCANIGHKQDDESGLIYIRARYYEPTSGRFVSEDLACDKSNWFLYCDSDPVNGRDYSGNEEFDDSFDPVYSFRDDLVETAIDFALDQTINAPKGIARRYVGRNGLVKLMSKYSWLKDMYRNKLVQKGVNMTFKKITEANLKSGMYARIAIHGSIAAMTGLYVMLTINARHYAWWDFCFGDEG
jgi:RHS repeat-associated protein